MDKKKVFDILDYIPLLFLVSLIAGDGSPSTKFHTNQGLCLTIYSVIIGIIAAVINLIVGLVPLLGGIVQVLVNIVAFLLVAVFCLIGILNVVNGKEEKLPIIGQFTLIQ